MLGKVIQEFGNFWSDKLLCPSFSAHVVSVQSFRRHDECVHKLSDYITFSSFQFHIPIGEYVTIPIGRNIDQARASLHPRTSLYTCAHTSSTVSLIWRVTDSRLMNGMTSQRMA